MKNIKLLEVIENTKQLPQVQYNLERQLIELRVMANKLGLYDAADFLNKQNMKYIIKTIFIVLAAIIGFIYIVIMHALTIIWIIKASSTFEIVTTK